jgi:hypothetical protein
MPVVMAAALSVTLPCGIGGAIGIPADADATHVYKDTQ